MLQDHQNNGGLSLIEYAAFFGSIQIFNPLRLEGVELKPSLWPLVIHGKNSEMIHFLEDNHVELEDKSYKRVFNESIKCHHNDIVNYFINNFWQNDEGNSQDTINQYLNYCTLVDNLLKDEDIDVNKKEIFNILLI